MEALLKEMEREEHWQQTHERMMLKENLDINELAEIELAYHDGYHKKVLEQIRKKEFTFGRCEKRLLNKIGTDNKRTVYMYDIKDRYILGGMYRAFSEYYKEEISENVFSYKRGIKTLDAIEYILADRELAEKHGVKLDISAYFNSINKESLTRTIEEISGGDSRIQFILGDLLLNEKVYYRGEIITEYKSIVPGTPFSSFLANYILKEIDDFIVEELGITYARYSDDLILFADEVEELEKALGKIKVRLVELGLTINEDKYEWYKPGEEITYLGLKIKGDRVDISDNSARKYKKKIKRASRDGRKRIEISGRDAEKEAINFFKRLNHRVYKCYIQDKSKFGWAYYAFRYVNTLETLRELDFYTKDRARQMITGRNNSANIWKVTDEKLEELGYVSLCSMYLKFKEDFDMYCDTVDLIKT